MLTMYFPSDIDIAQKASPKPIRAIAEKIGLKPDDYDQYGTFIAKLSSQKTDSLVNSSSPKGKLILVSSMNSTPAGEGKTTVSVGLADALNVIGKSAMLCLREPAMGPCFGVKGGAAGGGYAQVLPMEEINLHFTGDFHAIGLANNLLAAAIDNHIHHGNALNIDSRSITWTRVVDMNDRALRRNVVGLGGTENAVPREEAFEIVVASEVMACFCLATGLMDLKRRLGNIIVGRTYDKNLVYARDLKVHGAMAALLKNAIRPNLVQTLEGTPAFVHGGPFANIAHGANSIIATKSALHLADYVVTEAGFGTDLGGEKFMNIVSRKAGFHPDAVVIVATARSLKMNGGMAMDQLREEHLPSLARGIDNLKQHISNMQDFGLPVVVALNHFVFDTENEISEIKKQCASLGVDVIETRVWERGGQGGAELARAVVRLIEDNPPDFHYLYESELPLWEKVEAIATKIYKADYVEASKKVRDKFQLLQQEGFGHFPICIAKTQYSFSSNPKLLGAPRGFSLQVRDIKLAAGAEFVIVYCGDIMTLPGLPKVPAAEWIDIDDSGRITGLF